MPGPISTNDFQFGVEGSLGFWRFSGLSQSTAPVVYSPAPKRAVGEQRVLVVMARFPDVEPSLSTESLREKYFDKLDRYLRAVSYGKTWVKGKATAWRTLPHGVAHYRISPRNLEVDKGKVTRLIQDALDLVDREEDLSRYAMVFISLGARRSDYGMMGLCGYPGMLGWQAELPQTELDRIRAELERNPDPASAYEALAGRL